MANLEHFKARLCDTASGILIYRQKVLLVHHKKLNVWLPPGGHIESNELPHRAAEREFFEETGVKVKAVSASSPIISTYSQFLPTPFAVNLHWISKENYDRRLKSSNHTRPAASKMWPKGCEQHYVFVYLVKPTGSLKLVKNSRETHAIGWFSKNKVIQIETTQDIKNELSKAFQLVNGVNKEDE